MAKIQISPEAKNDLKEIKMYITAELASPKAAANTISKITKAIRKLKDFPDIGAPLSQIITVQCNYRFLVSGSYLTFYRHERGVVSVIRVIYGKRDYIKVLFGDVQEDEPELYD
jgi:addiction module RelE/StbE family toxin